MGNFELAFDASLVRELAKRYVIDGTEKDLINDIVPRAQERGFFEKEEFISLCYWKTVRTQKMVASNSAGFIEEATRIALSSPIEEIRIGILMQLYGVSMPTASAVLHLSHQSPYPILDFRAFESLGKSAKDSANWSVALWLEYTEFCRKLASELGVTMRILDRALWQNSYENSRRKQ